MKMEVNKMNNSINRKSRWNYDGIFVLFDCFIDGYGFFKNDHVNFSMKNEEHLIIDLFDLKCLQNY